MKFLNILIIGVLLVGCQSTSKSFSKKPIEPIPTSAKENNQIYPIVSIVPIVPKYPKRAAKVKQEGWVQLYFDVDKNGNVINAKVIKVSPEGFEFGKEALRVIKKWKYNPVISKSHNAALNTVFDFKLIKFKHFII
ncbi:energy transducer TonB [Colwellia piezophila]|uniref:energy transducer TonB n=1 Tax=Colwellia piezophila TaxID=211668 RepID=UPI00146A7D8E|nr:energy transducer TonB [Colwellia piezophila]